MENVYARYYQHSTYNHDYNKSPRGNPSHGDSSPRGGYNQDSHPRGEPRYFREAPKEFIDNRYGDAPPRQPVQPGEQFFVQEPRRSPHHSPISPRRQPPYSDRSDRRGYDGVSPPPMVGANSPRRYPHYDMTRQDLPPMNTYAINSTTQHDYGDFNTRTTQKEYGDFAQKQLMINDIRAQGDPELARRYDKKYGSRPYFDEKDPPSFYRDLPLTDRSGYDVDRRAPRLDDGPLTDRSERNRRLAPPGPSPLPPDHALNDMAKGQMKKELDRIELHDGNFKPYSHHNLGGGLDPFSPLSPGASSGSKEHQVISGPVAHHKRLYERPPSKGPGVLSRSIGHHQHRYEDNLIKTTSPRRSQDPGVLSRQTEHHEHRFENNLIETNNPRSSKDSGVLSRQIENHELPFENNHVETNYPRGNKIMHPREDKMEPEGPFYPDVMLRPEERMVKQKLPMHDYHRFEQVHKTDYPERFYADPKQGHQNPAGVFLLLRTDDQGFQDVKRQFERFTGDTPARKLLGIATSDMIDVKEGGAGWQRQSVLARWNGQYYNQERRGAVEKMLAVQWFPGEQKARDWINMDREFKHSAFPIPYGNQTSVLPLKYQPSSGKGYKTFMMMEFNNIADKHELRKYIDFMSKEMTRYNADIAFIDAAPVSVKSTIFDPRSHIVCHMFCDVREANRCFEELIEGRNFQHADVTTVVFSLLDIMRK
ncbi:uncharacterized protein LOC110450814 isoform X3 [Mizuhopecten yessoensis]|uniref:uncharacterized protein LOC110450814 isoform X3 n=1 Tax=Mizuhopecten yessoensis TaxID=6573 RepID=UPI000B458A55|nr:uncharacterized protein LOC110450814 isoform X3 [Mizuhopecten yessoensis]